MLAMAALLPTNTPAPMIPPMEIITRWRASRDLDSRAEAGAEVSLAFNGYSLPCGGAADAAHLTPFRRGSKSLHAIAGIIVCGEEKGAVPRPHTRFFRPEFDQNLKVAPSV